MCFEVNIIYFDEVYALSLSYSPFYFQIDKKLQLSLKVSNLKMSMSYIETITNNYRF